MRDVENKLRNKYTVIKNEDIKNLSELDKMTLDVILEEINNSNEYWIVNQDEPYAKVVEDLIFNTPDNVINNLKESSRLGDAVSLSLSKGVHLEVLEGKLLIGDKYFTPLIPIMEWYEGQIQIKESKQSLKEIANETYKKLGIKIITDKEQSVKGGNNE